MNGVFSNLTAALLALHTVLGCCWHHAHCCTETCDDSKASVACQDESSHSPDAPADTDGQRHHGRHDCQGSACVFVKSTGTSWQASALPLNASPAELASANSPQVSEGVGHPTHYHPDALLPPLRLHLLCRVLLI